MVYLPFGVLLVHVVLLWPATTWVELATGEKPTASYNMPQPRITPLNGQAFL